MAKAVLVDGLVNDALALLAAFEDESEEAEATSALGLLALVAGQDVEQGDDGTWQIARKVAPDRVISSSTPKPATCTSRARSTGTATRPTSPSNPRPAS